MIAALALSLLAAACGPASVIFGRAESIQLSSPPETTVSRNGWDYDIAQDLYTVKDGMTVVVEGSTTSSSIAAQGTVTLTLKSVSIDTQEEGWVSPIALLPGANVTVILEGTSRLTAGWSAAGLSAPEGTTLQITSVDGVLYAQGGYSGAGIGGSADKSAGTITISGGTVYASGGIMASGVGGGNEGNGGAITISGGWVTATGFHNGSGIGGGSGGSGGTILINYPGTSRGTAEAIAESDDFRGYSVGPGAAAESHTGSFNGVTGNWPGGNPYTWGQ